MTNATNFYLEELRPLVGATVLNSIRTRTDEFGDQYVGLLFACKDGKKRVLVFLRDDEGNGPGSFEIRVEG